MNGLRVFAALYGGSNYSAPDRAEEFSSLEEVRREWEARRSWPNRSREGLLCPLWGDGLRDWLAPEERATAALVWFISPEQASEIEEAGDDLGVSISEGYPDRVLSLGPRNGLRFEPA